MWKRKRGRLNGDLVKKEMDKDRRLGRGKDNWIGEKEKR